MNSKVFVMTNNTQKNHQFYGHSLSLISQNNDIWLKSEDIGIALEYKNPRKSIINIYNRNKIELDQYSIVTNLMTVDNRQRKTRVFNEAGMMIITMLSCKPKAVEFGRWAVKILKICRKNQSNQIQLPTPKKQSSSSNIHLWLTIDENGKAQSTPLNQITDVNLQLDKYFPSYLALDHQMLLKKLNENTRKVNKAAINLCLETN